MYGNDSQPTRIWQFGAKAPSINADIVEDEIRKAHRYKNAMVQLERERRVKVASVTREHFPDITRLDEEIAAVEADLGSHLDCVRRQNAKERRKTGTPEQRNKTAEYKSRLKELRDEHKTIRLLAYGPQEVKDARKTKDKDAIAAAEAQWFSDVPEAQELRLDLNKVDQWAQDDGKRLRKESGLYWGNYLVAEQAMQGAKHGAPPKFKRFDGRGRISVQLQGGLSPEDLAAGTDTRLRVEQISGKRWRAYLRVGSEGRDPIFAGVDFYLHRTPPEDCQLKWAYLIRKRVGTEAHWRLQLVLARESWRQEDRATSGSVGIDVGWRLVKNGLRVSYWVGSDGEEDELVMPMKLAKAWQKADSIRSIRDRHFDCIRPLLAEWMRSQETLPEWFLERFRSREDKRLPSPAMAASRLLLWKSPARLAGLIIRWRDERIPGDEITHPRAREVRDFLEWKEAIVGKTKQRKVYYFGRPESLFDLLDFWRKKDKHLYNWECAQRAKAEAKRLDMYRSFAAELRRKYATAHVEDCNWATLAKNVEADEENPNGAMKQYMRVAAPGTLIKAIEESMDTVAVSAVNTTRRHYDCGHMSGEQSPEMLLHTCGHCGMVFDQDQNAALNLLHCETSNADMLSVT